MMLSKSKWSFDYTTKDLTPEAHYPLFKFRQLAIYPECAVLVEKGERYACCNKLGLSLSGVDFCYEEIIYQEGKFDECSFDSYFETFRCCSELYEDD